MIHTRPDGSNDINLIYDNQWDKASEVPYKQHSAVAHTVPVPDCDKLRFVVLVEDGEAVVGEADTCGSIPEYYQNMTAIGIDGMGKDQLAALRDVINMALSNW